MLGISRLRNPIQSYAWGSRTDIARFLGAPSPTPEPQAELWMGAHPTAPSEVEVDGRWTSLADVIAADPGTVLGEDVVSRHGATLPFLLKVLAAKQALSIQAHPDRQQAEAGCQREDALDIPRRALARNYRDANHKPEVIYALTPFTILRGFREPDEIFELMARLDLWQLLPEVGQTLQANDLEGFFKSYMTLEPKRLGGVLSRALANIETANGDALTSAWVAKLDQQFPGDRGVLSPLFLHLRKLAPGEAIFTGPGVLHAYLEGTGVELMANSDNVVRGGLTPKHVDVQELLRILCFEPEPPRALDSNPGVPASSLGQDGGERRFEAVADEFALSVIEVGPGEPYRRNGDNIEILLCSRGDGIIRDLDDVEHAFSQGDSLLVPASVGGYRVEGQATVFRACVPVAR